jgi:predicted O-linked N-acetylglucosamine transferase (SPINDLY family)
LKLQPDSAAAAQCLLFEMQHVCDWSRLEELWEHQRRSARDPQGQQFSSFSMLSVPLTPAEQLQCMKNFSRHQLRAALHDRDRPHFRFERKENSRIRVGYLSADFHEHATAYLMAELFELHDRGRFEIAAYSYGPDDGSPMRERLKQAFDHFSDISSASHADAADRIHRDQVDILVDLKGYTHGSRTEIVAMRPAPIQVNYLGYPGTMGADFIDYLVTDRFITPREHAEHFSEKLAYLPGCYQVNDRKRSVAATPPRGELGLSQQSFVFCCLNQTFKIVPQFFAAWMRLLKAVPGSVLWLLESNPWAAQNLRQQARNHGIDPRRLIFAPMCPSARHIARMGAADLFLDTAPCNAHTTTSDALWAGLPVLTCAGNTFASRVAGSVLTAAGMPELVTHTMEAYEAFALRLAGNPGELAGLREKLARNRTSAPLFDTPSFARHLEALYLRMWENYLSGNAPRAIEL